ncbi:hypothetical protein FGG78_23535 [Thioclava sp. BHET1]|nr:hypothetical protein FGG78_23535 [Thioclava sp. BHET1]
MVAHGSAGTIDPQVNYTQEFWQLYQNSYDQLVAFKQVAGKASTDIVPDLATEIPKAEDGGKTYVFHLRQGIKFSNGEPLTVQAVYNSFVRIFKVHGPTAGTFYNDIVGADACLKDPDTCSLKDGVVIDPKANTVTFHLVQPDSEFFDKLAVPHAAILPADTPMKGSGVTPLPGTGAYMIKTYVPDQKLIMVRNPYFKEWSKDAQPQGYPDEIDYNFGLTDDAQVTAIENGQADWMYDTPPADRLNEMGTRYAKQVHVNPLAAFYYMSMNVNLAPFNNVKVRQAVNYALDRNAIVNLWGGKVLAQPACTILPPEFPGFAEHCDYTKNPGDVKWTAPDMAKAKELVKEGVLKGPALVQLCMGVPWGAPDDLNTFMAMVNNVPQDWHWSAFSLGRNQMPYVAAAVLAGGNVRVGLEDNLMLDRGVLATNAQLVDKSVGIIERLGARVIGPAEVREKLGLVKRAPVAR